MCCGRQRLKAAVSALAVTIGAIGGRELLDRVPALNEHQRGLRGVKLVISDDHKGLKAVATRILGATWRRSRRALRSQPVGPCRPPGPCASFPPSNVTAVAQVDAASAKVQWRQVADQLKPKVPKLAVLMDEAEHDVLAHMSFPRDAPAEIALVKPDRTAPCRFQASHQRRRYLSQRSRHHTSSSVTILLEQNDEWAVSRTYMPLESIAPLTDGVTHHDAHRRRPATSRSGANRRAPRTAQRCYTTRRYKIVARRSIGKGLRTLQRAKATPR